METNTIILVALILVSAICAIGGLTAHKALGLAAAEIVKLRAEIKVLKNVNVPNPVTEPLSAIQEQRNKLYARVQFLEAGVLEMQQLTATAKSGTGRMIARKSAELLALQA